MNLLDAFKQYIKDAMPGGALNPEWTPERVGAAQEIATGLIPGYGLVEAKRDVEQGNYGSAAANVGLLALPPMIAGPLRPGGLKKAEQALIALSKGQHPSTSVIADLTPKQFSDLNAMRVERGLPTFKTPEVLYNGKHHFASRQSKDGATVQEMLAQLEASLDETALATKHNKSPFLQSQTERLDQWGDSVKDRAIFEGGGDRPTWLFSAFGRKQK